VLSVAVRAGFALLVLTFLMYMLGIQQPLVSVDQLPNYWGLPLRQFVKATHTPTGWAWFALLGKSDMLNLIGIAALAATPAFSCLAILPALARNREFALFWIALLQIVVLVVSASNVLAAVQ
jgi:hypothetical protein